MPPFLESFTTWPTLLLAGGCVWLAVRLWVFRRRVTTPMAGLSVAQGTLLMESLYAGLGDACLLVAEDGEILYANEGAGNLFATQSALIGRRLGQILPDPRVSQFIAKAFAVETGALEDEFVITVHPRGRTEERYFVFNAAPVRVLNQKFKQVRLVVRDETRRQETEQIRRDFVTNASHELRTPLAIINGYLENLLEGDIDDGEATRRTLATMQKHGERLAHLVEDMLVISRFEAPEEHAMPNLTDQSFSCRECVMGVMDRLHPLFEVKNARFILDLPDDNSMAGDRFYWDQIFFNLVENALKENSDDARLVITISMEHTPYGVTIRVRDNGIGIPHEHLPFIFKRFYRVAKDHSSQQVKGTGLGLSIVKRAVEAHSGTIEVESAPGMRTEFVIKVPKLIPPTRIPA